MAREVPAPSPSVGAADSQGPSSSAASPARRPNTIEPETFIQLTDEDLIQMSDHQLIEFADKALSMVISPDTKRNTILTRIFGAAAMFENR